MRQASAAGVESQVAFYPSAVIEPGNVFVSINLRADGHTPVQTAAE
jgi:hypothetical protein